MQFLLLIQNYDFDTVKDRLEKVDKKIDEKFWTAIRGNLNTVEEIKQWTDIVYDSKIIEPKDKEFISTAIDLMPKEPWDDNTWDRWTSAIKEKTNRKGKVQDLEYQYTAKTVNTKASAKNITTL